MEWEARYLESAGSSVAHIIQTNDSGYLMAGTLGSHYVPNVVWLVKVDSNGKMQWNQSFSFLNNAAGLVKTWDGGYMMAGDSYTEIEGLWGVTDPQGIVLVKMDQYGNIEWNKTLTGTIDGSSYMMQTSDAGYIIIGNIDGDQVTFENTVLPTKRGFLIKTDYWGNVQWNQTYGDREKYYSFNSVIQTSDGGYAVAGSTNFNGTIGIFQHFWLLKVDPQGNALLTKTYGWSGTMEKVGGDANNRDIYAPSINQANCIMQTADGGFVLAGDTEAYGAGADDVWLVKTDSSGNMVWNRTYGGSGITFTEETTPLGSYTVHWGSNGTGYDSVNAVIETSDGGFAFAGITPTTTLEGGGTFGMSSWLVKLDSSGNTQWNQTYPTQTYPAVAQSYDWNANSLIETSDGGFAIAGALVETGAVSYYFLIKTQQALPPPSPTPIPTPNPYSPSPQTVLPSDLNPIWNVLIASGIVFLVFSGIILLRKRKRQFSTTSS